MTYLIVWLIFLVDLLICGRQIMAQAKGPSININVHRNPNNVMKGGGGKCLVRILLLTKTLNISIIHSVTK